MAKQGNTNITVTINGDQKLLDALERMANATDLASDTLRKAIEAINAQLPKAIHVNGGFTGGGQRFAEVPGPHHPHGIYVHGAAPMSGGRANQRDVPRGNDISLERARQRVAEATDAL